MRRLALFACVILTGCASAFDQRVSVGDYFPAYSALGFSAFAAGGPLVEIRGAPPGGADPDTVAAALRLPSRLPQAAFRTVAPGAAPNAQRIVLAFGSHAANPDLLCRGEVQGAQRTDALVVASAFCVGRRAASGTALRDVRPLGPEDPAFAVAMRRMLDVLAPERDPNASRDRDPCFGSAC